MWSRAKQQQTNTLTTFKSNVRLVTKANPTPARALRKYSDMDVTSVISVRGSCCFVDFGVLIKRVSYV